MPLLFRNFNNHLLIKTMEKIRKILLNESEMPRQWYNIVADMPNKPLPPLNPATREPIGPEALAPVFPYGAYKTGGLGRKVY
jgi:hypothetical protein